MTGREIDALVAEKVMGKIPCEGVAPYHNGLIAMGYKACPHEWDLTCTASGIPNYSTDIAAAWMVVEKMGGILLEHSKATGRWAASFDQYRSRIDVLGQADTAPMAICLAALKAVGVEVPA